MTFVHEDAEFDDVLRIVAGRRGLAIGLVEKDYWVTHALWALHAEGFDVWFKGGTSLSKGFGLIEVLRGSRPESRTWSRRCTPARDELEERGDEGDGRPASLLLPTRRAARRPRGGRHARTADRHGVARGKLARDVPRSAPRGSAGYEATTPMFGGPRLSLDEVCATIRTWIAARL